MTYTIHPVHPSDSPDLATTMMTAMHRDPHWAALWPSKPLPSIISDCASRLPWNLVSGSPLKRHQKVVDDSSGEVVGYARWILPEGMEDAWPEARVPECEEGLRGIFRERFEGVMEGGRIRGLDWVMAEGLSGAIEEGEEEVTRDEGGGLLALDYLATHADHQRKGIASLLLKSGFRFADGAGLKIIVCSKAQGVKLYEKHGFKVGKVLSQERPQYGWTEPHVTTIMVRQPQSA